jgi:hypothetical protein
MPWSRLQTPVQDLFAPSLRGRVALHQARYRRTREEVGRVWVEVDGREIASFDTTSYIRRRDELGKQLFEIRRAESGGRAPGSAAHLETDRQAREILHRAGESDDYGALIDLEAYLSLPIDDALTSPSPLVRALAVIDRRVGKRRLRAIAVGQREHPVVRELYALRCAVEGLEPSGPAAAAV